MLIERERRCRKADTNEKLWILERDEEMEKTLVVWRRFGKEHGEGRGFKINTQDIIDRHIEEKVNILSKTNENEWRWWKVSNKLIIEKVISNENSDMQKVFYYLPHKNWIIVKNFHSNHLGGEWNWYIHIGDIDYSEKYNCWIFTDLFCDIIVQSDKKTHSILDLDELGNVFNMGLIDSKRMVKILNSTQELIDNIREGNFPPEEIQNYL